MNVKNIENYEQLGVQTQSVLEDFIFLYNEYYMEDNEKLTRDGLFIKNAMKSIVENLEGEDMVETLDLGKGIMDIEVENSEGIITKRILNAPIPYLQHMDTMCGANIGANAKTFPLDFYKWLKEKCMDITIKVYPDYKTSVLYHVTEIEAQTKEPMTHDNYEAAMIQLYEDTNGGCSFRAGGYPGTGDLYMESE